MEPAGTAESDRKFSRKPVSHCDHWAILPPVWIMIAGPYRAETSDPCQWHDNLLAVNDAAYAVFSRGHVPIVGVNMALPIIEAAGEATYDSVMRPLCLSLADRCDAILRIGGPSSGADEELAAIRRRDKPVFLALEEIPAAGA